MKKRNTREMELDNGEIDVLCCLKGIYDYSFFFIEKDTSTPFIFERYTSTPFIFEKYIRVLPVIGAPSIGDFRHDQHGASERGL